MAAPASVKTSDSSNLIGETSANAGAQYDALAKVLPGKVLHPSGATYHTSGTSYCSKQEEEISPGCMVKSLDTNDVALANKALAFVYESSQGSANLCSQRRWPYPGTGSASIQGGAVIGLTSIKAVALNANQTMASVGSGAKWSEVCSYLDSERLAVSGGRAAQVGVGGLSLGGMLNGSNHTSSPAETRQC